jgi:hypothetical protein
MWGRSYCGLEGLKTYARCQEHFASRKAGTNRKPIGKSGDYLYLNSDGSFEHGWRHGGNGRLFVKPDNTVVICSANIGSGVLLSFGIHTYTENGYTKIHVGRGTSEFFYPGIVFELESGRLLSKRMEYRRRVLNPERQREITAAVSRYASIWRTMVKIGGIRATIDGWLADHRDGPKPSMRLNHAEAIGLILEQDFCDAAILGFVAMGAAYYLSNWQPRDPTPLADVFNVAWKGMRAGVYKSQGIIEKGLFEVQD